jgi:hypothetical protein
MTMVEVIEVAGKPFQVVEQNENGSLVSRWTHCLVVKRPKGKTLYAVNAVCSEGKVDRISSLNRLLR